MSEIAGRSAKGLQIVLLLDYSEHLGGTEGLDVLAMAEASKIAGKRNITRSCVLDELAGEPVGHSIRAAVVVHTQHSLRPHP